MAAKSNYLESALLNHVLRNTAYTSPTTVYVGLLTAVPTDDSVAGTEVSGNAYARQAATFSAPAASGGTGSPRRCQNFETITFPVATPAGWGTITGFGIYDASSAGNLLYWADITDKTINAGDTAQFAANSISVQED